MDNSTETSLALDDGVGDTHLAAESGKEDNQLNGVNVVSDQDKGSLLVLNKTDNVVQTVLDIVRLLADVLLLLALRDSGSLAVQTLLLLGLGLRAVLVEELEGLGSGVAVQSVLELGDRGGNLEAEVQDLLLALQTDVLGPLDKAAEVALGLDVLANTEVASTLLDKGVLWGVHQLATQFIPSKAWRLDGDYAHLGALLASTSLTLGVGHGGNLLTGLVGGRLSLRKEDQSTVPPTTDSSLNSKENASELFLFHISERRKNNTRTSSQIITAALHPFFRMCANDGKIAPKTCGLSSRHFRRGLYEDLIVFCNQKIETTGS